jgi:hypothetical protein
MCALRDRQASRYDRKGPCSAPRAACECLDKKPEKGASPGAAGATRSPRNSSALRRCRTRRVYFDSSPISCDGQPHRARFLLIHGTADDDPATQSQARTASTRPASTCAHSSSRALGTSGRAIRSVSPAFTSAKFFSATTWAKTSPRSSSNTSHLCYAKSGMGECARRELRRRAFIASNSSDVHENARCGR